MIAEENLHDVLERLESIVPEYSYADVKSLRETDAGVRSFLLSQIRQVKDYMFHVVQVSYELHRDRLSEAAEDAWDDIESLVDMIENSRTSHLRGNRQYCGECLRRIEGDMYELMRRDRELSLAVSELKRVTHGMYRQLFERGNEKHFIKNLKKIKKCIEEIQELLKKRERCITGE